MICLGVFVAILVLVEKKSEGNYAADYQRKMFLTQYSDVVAQKKYLKSNLIWLERHAAFGKRKPWRGEIMRYTSDDKLEILLEKANASVSEWQQRARV